MTARTTGKLRRTLLVAGLAALVLTTASATAGNPGDPFLLGESNLVDATTSLSGTHCSLPSGRRSRSPPRKSRKRRPSAIRGVWRGGASNSRAAIAVVRPPSIWSSRCVVVPNCKRPNGGDRCRASCSRAARVLGRFSRRPGAARAPRAGRRKSALPVCPCEAGMTESRMGRSLWSAAQTSFPSAEGPAQPWE
jgi:hypothetical protein